MSAYAYARKLKRAKEERAARRAQHLAEIERRVAGKRAARKSANFARAMKPLTEEELIQYELPPLELIPGATHPDFPMPPKISKKGNKRNALTLIDAPVKHHRSSVKRTAIIEDVPEVYPRRKLPGAMKAKITRVGSLQSALNEPITLYQEGRLPGGDRTLGKTIAKAIAIRRAEGEDRAALAAEAKANMENLKLRVRAFRIAYNKLKRKQISPEQRLRNAQRARARRGTVSRARELPFAGMEIE